MTQKSGASNRWTKARASSATTSSSSLEEPGGISPNDAHERMGEVSTYTWSLYRDQLPLEAVEGAISPETFLAKPWTRVD